MEMEILSLLHKCPCKAEFVLIVTTVIKKKKASTNHTFQPDCDYQECQFADCSEQIALEDKVHSGTLPGKGITEMLKLAKLFLCHLLP